jgi:hypothetical protein
MQLRSGATTGGTAPVRTPPRSPSPTPGGGVPDQIEITSLQRQEEDEEVSVPRTPVQSPQVYTAGTYVANFGRSPSEPANFRPAQFSFLPQLDYRTAREPSDPGDPVANGGQPDANRPILSQPVVPSPQNQLKSGEALRTFTFEAPMRPLDVARNMYLDYTTTQSIKFYNKGCEKLPGDPFNGKMLMTWLVQVQDKANMFTWTSILTIKGKLLTQHFTELTMEEVRAHVQAYQDRNSREAQNAEMLIQCLKSSISKPVYNKVYLQMDKYTIYRKNTFEPIQDGVCFLKTIIDNYHSNTRSSAKLIRQQLATLNYYMKNVAKGDMMKLCEHTRELMFELNAVGETTNDLLANLIEALKEAPDNNFQRWLSNQVDLWSMRKLDWKQDGSDLMEQAEIYYLEAIKTHRWGRKAYRHDVQYVFKAINSETETEEEKEKPKTNSYEEMIKALTAQLQEQTAAYTARWSGPSANTQQDMDKRYAWKRVPPKSGEPSTKRMYSDGKNKTYHWCPHHNEWTIHTAAECKRLKPTRGKKDYKNKKAIKRQDFKDKKQAFIQAKAAYEACLGADSDDERDSMDSDNDEGSNRSASSYSSEGSNDS